METPTPKDQTVFIKRYPSKGELPNMGGVEELLEAYAASLRSNKEEII